MEILKCDVQVSNRSAAVRVIVQHVTDGYVALEYARTAAERETMARLGAGRLMLISQSKPTLDTEDGGIFTVMFHFDAADVERLTDYQQGCSHRLWSEVRQVCLACGATALTIANSRGPREPEPEPTGPAKTRRIDVSE